MRHLIVGIIGLIVITQTGWADDRRRAPVVRKEAATVRDPAAEGRVRGWVASAGLGLFFDPSLFLINPQLEYVWKPHVHVGPNVQLGLGNGTVFTGTATIRLLIGHQRIKPCLETGLGIAVAGSEVGLHIPLGIGVDYQLERGIALGTMFRGNFMPPARTFIVSWPILVARLAI